MPTKTTTPNEKISKAVNLVNQAKNQKIETTKESLKTQWDTGVEKAQEYKAELDTQWHKNREMAEQRIKDRPFYFVAGATLLGVILGFLLGKKR